MTQSDLLGPLVEAIETVKGRITEHGPSLRENEIRTRAALIDPILKALGWDVSDPDMVMSESPMGSGRVDYALRGIEGPMAVALEAKKLDESLHSHRDQMLTYANSAGVRYAGLTDGNHWELYDVFRPVPLPQKQILDIAVASSSLSAHELALKLLLLWRPNLVSGTPVEAGKPIVGVPVAPTRLEDEESSTPIPDEGTWVPLESVYSLNGSKVKPQAIKFSDGQSTLIRNWNDVWMEFGRYVHTNNLLHGKTLPLESSTFRKPILGSSRFSETCKQVDNLPVFVEWAANTFLKLKWTEYLAKQLEIGIVKVRLKD